MAEFFARVRKGIGKTEVVATSLRGVCDFCLTKGKVYRLRSSYRTYRYLNICEKCLKKLKKCYKTEKKA